MLDSLRQLSVSTQNSIQVYSTGLIPRKVTLGLHLERIIRVTVSLSNSRESVQQATTFVSHWEARPEICQGNIVFRIL